MKTNSITTFAVIFFALVAVAGWIIMHPNSLPQVDGPDEVGCTSEQSNATPPTKVVILHIAKDIFGDLVLGGGDCAASEVCVSSPSPVPTSNPVPEPATSQPIRSVTGPDDDNILDYGNPVTPEPVSIADGSTMNWATPLDIDLDPNHDGALWKISNPILLKIVLDNPKYTFLRAKTNAPGDATAYAVRQGYEGTGMFGCVSRPRIIKGDNRWFITVRVFNNSKTAPYGGLNIGVLVPITDGAGKPKHNSRNTLPLVVPIYIDPQIHNNG